MKNILKILSLTLMILSHPAFAAAHSGAAAGAGAPTEEAYVALLAMPAPATMGGAAAMPTTDAATEAKRIRDGQAYAESASSTMQRYYFSHHAHRAAVHDVVKGAKLKNKWCMEKLAEMYSDSKEEPLFHSILCGCCTNFCAEGGCLCQYRVCCPQAAARDLYKELIPMAKDVAEREKYARLARNANYYYLRDAICCWGVGCSIPLASSIAIALAATGKIE